MGPSPDGVPAPGGTRELPEFIPPPPMQAQGPPKASRSPKTQRILTRREPIDFCVEARNDFIGKTEGPTTHYILVPFPSKVVGDDHLGLALAEPVESPLNAAVRL